MPNTGLVTQCNTLFDQMYSYVVWLNTLFVSVFLLPGPDTCDYGQHEEKSQSNQTPTQSNMCVNMF